MNTLDAIEWSSYIVEAALAALCAALCFRRARKYRNASLFFYLLTGFYACMFMSDAFFLLTWIVEDYPFVFSAGDISWIGGFFFLITAAMSLTDEWTPPQRQTARKYRLPALAAPAVCVAFNIVYICIYPEIIMNYLLYAIPTVIFSYLALWLYLTARKGGAHSKWQSYHLAVLVWIAVQLLYDLFTTYREYYPFAVGTVVCGWLLTFATAGVYFALRKEAAR